MGFLDAAFDSVGGLLADQWKDIVTAGPFDEHTVVAPGVRKREQNGRGVNRGSDEVLTNGSVIFVPENTAAFVFSQEGIEQVIVTPGGYEYRDGEATLLDARDREEEGLGKILLGQAAERFKFGGVNPDVKRVAFVNLREIRNIRFGTRGPLVYNDRFYGTDLELFAYGSFTVKVEDPVLFVRNFLPAGASSCSFDDKEVRSQLVAEFLHSFSVAVNSLSSEFRLSQLPAQADAIGAHIAADTGNAGTWAARFGLALVAIAVENIEFSDQSRELVRQFSERRMNVAAYEGISQQAANVAAQQLIAQGVMENGLGDGGGILFGMNLAQNLNPLTAARAADAPAHATTPEAKSAQGASGLDAQIDALKKLKELLDAGILSQEEFDAKKRELLGL